jgi:hypothetical protein
LVAFDLSTGAVSWVRDLQTDAAGTVSSYDTGVPVKLCLDNSGNIVCMLQEDSHANQAFVTVTQSGSLVVVKNITIPAAYPATPATDFVVASDDSYHILRPYHRYGSPGSSNIQGVIDWWQSPFSSAPTSYEIEYNDATYGDSASILHSFIRNSNRNYYGFHYDTGPTRLSLLKGKSQSAPSKVRSDFDWKQLALAVVTGIAVDGSGNVYVVGASSTASPPSYLQKYNSSGTLMWSTECGGLLVAIGSDGYIYTFGEDFPSPYPQGATVQQYTTGGTFNWGHKHVASTSSSGTYQAALIGSSSNPGVIVSGQAHAYTSYASKLSSTDVNFLSNPCTTTPGCTGDCNYTASVDTITTTTYDSGSGSFTTSENCQIEIHSWGGGGGGAGTDTGTHGWQGGGSGGYVITGPYPALAGETVNYSIGVGGNPGTNSGVSDGSNGGDTMLTGFFTATAGGGKGGLGDNPGTNTGAGGIASGDTTATNGNTGLTSATSGGGNGGSAPGGGGSGGTGGASSGSDGSPGTVPGGGGGGSGKHGTSGGAGAHGRVTITITLYKWVTGSNSCSGSCSSCPSAATIQSEIGRPTSSTDTFALPCS